MSTPERREGRGLEEVLHYFIPEEEQAEARRRAASLPRADKPGVRWVVPARSDRPLMCALVVDVAAALSRSTGPVEVVAPFPPPMLAPRSALVAWRTIGADAGELTTALDSTPAGTPLLIVLPPDELRTRLAGIDPEALSGVLLPVEAASWGLDRSLAALRQLAGLGRRLRICTVVVSDDRERSQQLLRRLQGAARRQLDIEVENLGSLCQDATSFRSLLRGVSVFDVDSEAESSAALRALSEQLTRGAPSRGADRPTG